MALDPNLIPRARPLIDAPERARLLAAGALAIDTRRSRPRYFDGRFLAARDLTADQEYLLTRTTDLGRAAGAGVVEGLEVTRGARATEVAIRAGLGISPSGTSVILASDVVVDLLSLRNAELLDAQLGLRRKSTYASRVRSGAFVLCLRPVEYTANPRRGYPTSLEGERVSEDHDIVEATAITLVPWPSSGGDADALRSALVREVFVEQRARGLRADLVPLAIVYLDGVSVRWLDMHLVRRSLSAESDDLLGLGRAARSVRMAHVQQYREHLRDVLARTGTRSLNAADQFEVLPPVGELPAQALNRSEFTESFFPATLEVDLSIIPDDELPLLVEESLMLPPLDLTADEATLAATSIVVLVPVARARFRTFKQALANVRRTPLPRGSRFARATTLPLPRFTRLGEFDLVGGAALFTRGLGASLVRQPLTPLLDAESAAWTQALDEAAASGEGMFWFVRRPDFDPRADRETTLIDIDVGG
jgi:hypothetical protein